MQEGVVISRTESLCPYCLTKLPAARVAYGDKVYLEKSCSKHGKFQSLIWQGFPLWQNWARTKIPAKLKTYFTEEARGCPFDCGLCSQHRQQTCTALLEVTQRCNLNCTFCFAAAGSNPEQDPDLTVIKGWYQRLLEAGGPYNIQLSGGEPTVRTDLAEVVVLGRTMGFNFIQLNTNGLRLAQDPEYVRELKKAGLASVFLQFDGTENEIYTQLRGKPLLEEKIKAIENCLNYDLGIVLVPTLVPGINTHNIGEIIKFALKYVPTIRGVHFQPVSYFGRYPKLPVGEGRFTIPHVIRAIEEQTGGLVKVESFKPPGCENAFCSFHGNFEVQPNGKLKPRTKPNAVNCCPVETAEEGACKARAVIAGNWSLNKIITNPGPKVDNGIANSWDALLNRLRTSSFSISGMAFQDVWNLDLERLRDCCIHVVSPEGQLIPFCAYNLTDCHGNALYRKGR